MSRCGNQGFTGHVVSLRASRWQLPLCTRVSVIFAQNSWDVAHFLFFRPILLATRWEFRCAGHGSLPKFCHFHRVRGRDAEPWRLRMRTHCLASSTRLHGGCMLGLAERWRVQMAVATPALQGQQASCVSRRCCSGWSGSVSSGRLSAESWRASARSEPRCCYLATPAAPLPVRAATAQHGHPRAQRWQYSGNPVAIWKTACACGPGTTSAACAHAAFFVLSCAGSKPVDNSCMHRVTV